MYPRVRDLVLRLLKVPPEPHPPLGDPASLRVFRAGKNYFSLRLLGWGLGQLVALAGIIFWVVVLIDVEQRVHLRRQNQPAPPPLTAKNFAKTVEDAAKAVESVAESAKTATHAAATTVAAATAEGPQAGAAAPAAKDVTAAPPAPAEGGKATKARRRAFRGGGWEGFKQGLTEIALRLPNWAFPLLWVLKVAGFLAYLAQIPITFVILRIEYEMRWYIVTDRSLRIRTGAWKVQETTMSFANLQQVEVTQGPLQRLLGLADVRVQSAGGGSGEHDPHADDSMHRARFHGVANAPEIRDLILDRLRRYRAAGLGDPDDHRDQAPAPAAAAPAAELLGAARELVAEARALRTTLGG